MPRSLIAIDGAKIYIGILDLNKLTLLCCSLGYFSFVFSIVFVMPCNLVNKDFQISK